jgi:tetratricopeptide (TPR) repeat protein
MHKGWSLVLGLMVGGLVINTYPTEFASAQQSTSAVLETKLLQIPQSRFLQDDENDKKERTRIYDDRGSEDRQKRRKRLYDLSRVAYSGGRGSGLISRIEAEQVLQQMIPIRREFGDRRGEISDFIGIAMTYAQRMRHREAVENLKTAINLARSTGDLRTEYQVLTSDIETTDLFEVDRTVTVVYEYLIRRDSSFDWIPARLEYLEEQLNSLSRDFSLFDRIGNSYSARKEYLKAIEAYKKSISYRLLKKAKKDYHYKTIAKIQLKMGLLYKLIGKETEADDVFNNSLDSYSKLGISREYSNLLTNWLLTDAMEAPEVWDNLTTLAIAKNSDWLISKVIQAQITRYSKSDVVFRRIGDAYNRTGNYKTAIDYYKKALKLRLEMKEPNLDYVYTNYKYSHELALARTYANIGDNSTSLKYYLLIYNNYYLQQKKFIRDDFPKFDQEWRVEIYKIIGKRLANLADAYGASLLVEIGNCYKKLEETDKALDFYKQAADKLDNSMFAYGGWGGDAPQSSIISDEDDVGKLLTDTSKKRKTETTNRDPKK